MDNKADNGAPFPRTTSKLAWHPAQAALPLREKVRILLELQKQDLSLIVKHRALRSWERPWPIEP